jgi:hypothetical protein
LIDTREELIDALMEASELEHEVLVSTCSPYSMKKRLDEALTPGRPGGRADLEGMIAGVAREEMAHLGSLCRRAKPSQVATAP